MDKLCRRCGITKNIGEFFKNCNIKDGYLNHCKQCSNQWRILNWTGIRARVYKQTLLYDKTHPWIFYYRAAKKRCNSSSPKCFPYYKSKGIKCRITLSDLKRLWMRDTAYSMKRPSLDRIDSNGDYEFLNCRFLELSKHMSLSNLNRTKGARGIAFHKRDKRWYAQLKKDGKKYVGVYRLSAVQAYRDRLNLEKRLRAGDLLESKEVT